MPDAPVPYPIHGGAPEHGLRDLMGLLALPALWAGRNGQTIVELMTQAVASVVPLQVCYVDLPLLRDSPPFVRLWVFGDDEAKAQTTVWQSAISEWHKLPIGTKVIACDTPIGRLRMIRLSMGFSSGEGSVWFGSAAATFPTVNQIAVLRAATSLTATGVVAARAAHEREEANQAKDEFLAMLGHELRNPLAPITASLALIRRQRKTSGVISSDNSNDDATASDASDKYHEIIERQVEHLSRLVEDLLDVSRITRGKIVLQRELIRIGSIVTRAVEAVSPLIEQRAQRLSVNLSDDGALIYGDLTRMTQAFSNLLNNAAKYTQAGGRIRVDARVADGHLTTAISDDGAGISAELMPKLFKIFEQGRVTIDRSAGGLGIGLALVKNVVESHGGQVLASSPGLGMGSTFTVTLPIATPAEIASAPQTLLARSAENVEGVKVLLVDDNSDGLLAMEAFLSEMGFAVATAMNADQALDVADQFKPDVAVLDIGLPGMNGYDLAMALRTKPQHHRLRLFALTGYSQADDMKRSANAGFDGHFVKPVPLFYLVDVLNTRI